MLVSDAGRVYTFGRSTFSDFGGKFAITPKVVESLKHIFAVQVTIGFYFTAVLSREGSVYTFSWGTHARLGHNHVPNDCELRLFSGPWDRLPVVHIAAGNCYLLLLASQPSRTSVYSLGCGAGGKLGHGITKNGMYPLLIEHFQALNLNTVCISQLAHGTPPLWGRTGGSAAGVGVSMAAWATEMKITRVSPRLWKLSVQLRLFI